MTDNNMLKVDLFRYLWNTEINYENRLIAVQNDFNKHRVHSLTAFEQLYVAEREFAIARKITSDVEGILRMY